MLNKVAKILSLTMLVGLFFVFDSSVAKAPKKDVGYIILTHTVADYATFKKVFRKHEAGHKKAALKDEGIYRGVTNPNEVTIMFKTWDMKKSMDYFADPKNEPMLKEAGVIGKPIILFLHKAK